MTAAPHHPAASRLTDLPRPPWLPDGDWPFPTSALELDDGTRIAVTSVGRGPTVLFVHTGLWSFVWRDVIARLAADHRCVCFDAPGTGRSDRLPVAAINLERAARALVAVVRALDIADVTLVLHDLGGPSGLAGAARVADRIRALCAVNTFGWRPDGVLFRSVLALMGNPAVRELSAWSGILTRVTSTAFGVGRHLEARGRRAFRAGADPRPSVPFTPTCAMPGAPAPFTRRWIVLLAARSAASRSSRSSASTTTRSGFRPAGTPSTPTPARWWSGTATTSRCATTPTWSPDPSGSFTRRAAKRVGALADGAASSTI